MYTPYRPWESRSKDMLLLHPLSPRDRYVLQDISLEHALRLLPEVNPQR